MLNPTRSWWWLRAAVVVVALGPDARAASDAESLTLLPPAITARSVATRPRLLAQWTTDGEATRQATDGVTWTSTDPAVATIGPDGVIQPVKDGTTTVTARVGDRTAQAQVKVEGLAEPRPPRFRDDVEPMLAKLGCNSGACHGALAGKGGFRLSLNGYDPDADAFQIVKHDGGRRVELADPGKSLVLLKPTGAVAHKGGVRFGTDSTEYQLLAQWIAAGCPPPVDADPRVESLEIWPNRSTHAVGQSQRLVVQARYSDGRVEDVSRWVKWTSTDETVSRVDADGVATVVGPGEGAVVAWFSSRIALARLTVPYNEGKPFAPADRAVADQRKPRNYIDEQVDRQLARLNLPASPACDDAEFVRRAWVDTVGRPPTVAETRAFLASANPNKRDALIDELLARSEFVDYWTYKWSDVLMLTSARLLPNAVQAYDSWLRREVAANTPWDKLVRSILVSTGESLDNGATNFYALSQSPEDMVENSSQAFLGLSIGCARCHNHPLEKWTNDQYYAMANLFARVRAKGWGGDPKQGDGKRTLYVAQAGELIQPRTGKPQPPTPLDGKPLPIDDPADRRVALADWMTSPENPYFARAITNRVWANFFGVGLVEQVDDLRTSNPASNEPLLAQAAAEVVKAKFDLKTLMRSILQSNAYQRTSRTLAGNKAEGRFYSRYYPRRMMAEVMHDAIAQVTGVPTKFDVIQVPGGPETKTKDFPLGTRAIQLHDAAVENYFLQAFGRNPRRIVCECDRSDEPTVVQVLHLSNGDTLNQKLRAPGNAVEVLMNLRRQGMADASLVDEVYLSGLSRFPTEAERTRLVAMLPAPGAADERAALEDVFWGLLSSREFLFNH